MSERLTLQDLVDLLAEKQDITKKDSETFIRELVSLISETIEGKDFVRIKDFGTFKLTPVNARRSVDVNTGDPIEIPAHYKLSFTPDKVLREGVNKPFSHFESILIEEGVVFEDKDKAENKPEPNKAEPKKVEVKAESKKVEKPKPVVAAVIPPVIKEEEPAFIEIDKKEELAANKVDEVLKNTPSSNVLEEETLTVEQEAELADIDKFLTKEIEEKKVAVKPLVTTIDTSIDNEKSSSVRSTGGKYIEEDDFVDYDSLARAKKKRTTWISVAAFVAVLLAIGVWGYSKYFMVAGDNIPLAQDNSTITISEEEVVPDNGTDVIIAEEGSDDIAASQPVSEPVVEQPIETPAPIVKAPEQGSKEIEVKSGQTMRVLGQEYFGHGSFWVYIFEENRDRIQRPDAVYAGMKLIIPPASKYEIDPNDRNSVRKAQRQEMKLFGEFSDK